MEKAASSNLDSIASHTSFIGSLLQFFMLFLVVLFHFKKKRKKERKERKERKKEGNVCLQVNWNGQAGSGPAKQRTYELIRHAASGNENVVL